MIDEKKIKEAIRIYRETVDCCKEEELESFEDGIRWATNEFLKELWHPASEEPKTFKHLLTKCHLDRVRFKDMMFLGTISWNSKVESEGIICWLYIDDLFPKKGGKQ